MKKIKLEFKKEVISVLSENDLSKFWGGWKPMYSIDACETNEECNSIINCESMKESCQGKCFSDLVCKGGGGGTEEQPYINPPIYEVSRQCNSVHDLCANPYPGIIIGKAILH